MTDLSDAVVLITGATGGFGRQMTRQFLEAGSRLLITDIDPSSLNSLIEDFQSAKSRILGSIAADLSDDVGCYRLYDGVEEIGHVPDILINNAGLAVGGRFDQVPRERWERIVHVNLMAPMRLCYLFLPQMIERGSGHIVNISSLAGWIGTSGISAYCSSKFGLRGFGDSLASDYREFGIRVSTVYPYFSRTPILDSDQFGYAVRRKIPEDIATDPAEVVSEIIKGVRRNSRNIFPDKMSRRIHYLARFMPWIIPLLDRRLQQQVEQGSQVS